MTKRGVSQLRLQARGRSTRSGIAGRSLPCKRGFGLALPRADGEHHRARGRGASNKARDAASYASRGGWKPGPIRRLDRGCYWDKRERERERDVSALLTHLPTGPNGLAATPDTYVPNELTRKQLPHRSDTGPSPKETLYCATRSTTQGRPKPDPYVPAPHRAPLQETLYSTSSHMSIPNSKSTVHTSPSPPPKPPESFVPSGAYGWWHEGSCDHLKP